MCFARGMLRPLLLEPLLDEISGRLPGSSSSTVALRPLKPPSSPPPRAGAPSSSSSSGPVGQRTPSDSEPAAAAECTL